MPKKKQSLNPKNEESYDTKVEHPDGKVWYVSVIKILNEVPWYVYFLIALIFTVSLKINWTI